MARKHSKQSKRDIGKNRPTERKALRGQGFSKNVVTQMTRALKESPEPEEELRDMVIDYLSGETRLEDLVKAAKAAGLYGKLRNQLAEFNIHISEGRTVGSKSSKQIVKKDSPLIPKSRPGQTDLSMFDNIGLWGRGRD